MKPFAAAQVAALGVAVVLAWLYGSNMVRKRLLTLLGASLAGASLGLVLVALAPGNAERGQTTIGLPIPVGVLARRGLPPRLVAFDLRASAPDRVAPAGRNFR